MMEHAIALMDILVPNVKMNAALDFMAEIASINANV